MLVSAFVFGGTPKRALVRLFADAEIRVSPQLLSEYREVPLRLRAVRKISQDQMNLLVAGIASFVSGTNVILPGKRLSICRDPADNMILECCSAAGAELLVTGDRDLLEMEPDGLQTAGLQDLRILSPADYLR